MSFVFNQSVSPSSRWWFITNLSAHCVLRFFAKKLPSNQFPTDANDAVKEFHWKLQFEMQMMQPCGKCQKNSSEGRRIRLSFKNE